MPRLLFWAAATSFLLVSFTAFAQEKYQVGGIIGRTFVSDQSVRNTDFYDNRVRFGHGLTFEADFARRLKDFGIASIAVEVPAAFNFDEKLHYPLNVIPKSFSSIFVTPSIRANFLTSTYLSPWVSGGAGFGHFSESSTLVFGGNNPGNTGTTVSVIQFGFGLDVKFAPRWVLRGQVRDFYSGVPDLNVDTGRSRQHNYFVGGGLQYSF